MSENEWKLFFKEENEFDNLFFLFFLFYNDENKQEMKSHSFCFSFLHISRGFPNSIFGLHYIQDLQDFCLL